jgi:hypothetical protein
VRTALIYRSLRNPEQGKQIKFTKQYDLFGISECGKGLKKE